MRVCNNCEEEFDQNESRGNCPNCGRPISTTNEPDDPAARREQILENMADEEDEGEDE